MNTIKKYYFWVRDSLLPMGSKRRLYVKMSAHFISGNFDFVRQLWQNRNAHSSFVSSSSRGLWELKLKDHNHVVILTTKHCKFIADLIKQNLEKINIVSNIIYSMPAKGYEKVPHFVICPQMFDRLPDEYVAFQMEQSVSSRWFTQDYFKILNNALAVLDYSLVNIEYLQTNGFNLGKVYYLPVSFMEIKKTARISKKYDVIFYGDNMCERRKLILDRLSKYNIKVINNLFGDELLDELDKAKIIVNIHYYEGALLETTRLCECITRNNSVIISENSIDFAEHSGLHSFVDFVDIGDVKAIEELIEYYLANPDKIKEKLENNFNRFSSEDFCPFEFYFFRFLLASGNVKYEEFYQITGHKYEIKENQLALGLPETVDRYKDFCNDNKYSFKYFCGLRHIHGWIGCGLSYKFMLQQAKKAGFEQVTICEDDVYFKPDFAARYRKIRAYLMRNKEKWDIFSGLNADVADDTEISYVDIVDDEEFIYMNKTVSTVFNIYNKTFLDLFDDWDESNHDANTNTIDRYIENKLKIRAVVIIPYLVGHKEELDSTLWGFSNSTYLNMINRSEERLFEKAYQHKKINKEKRSDK